MLNVMSVLAETSNGGNGSIWGNFFIVPIFAAMYFLLIRPQRKRAKEQKELQGALAEGDHVLLNSGIYGYISQIEEDKPYIWFEANTGVEFRINRSAVAGKTPDPAKPDAEQK
jgi:preprotein translocase subunit YajC